MFKKLLSLTLVFSLATPSISQAIAPILIVGAPAVGACVCAYKVFCAKEKRTYFPDGRLKSVYKPISFLRKNTKNYDDPREPNGVYTYKGIPDVSRIIWFFGLLGLLALTSECYKFCNKNSKERHNFWAKKS